MTVQELVTELERHGIDPPNLCVDADISVFDAITHERGSLTVKLDMSHLDIEELGLSRRQR